MVIRSRKQVITFYGNISFKAEKVDRKTIQTSQCTQWVQNLWLYFVDQQTTFHVTSFLKRRNGYVND